MTRGEMLVRAMRMFSYVREQPVGSNSSEFIDHAIRMVKLGDPKKLPPAAKPWCAAGVSAVAHGWFGDAWPLPLSASVMLLYEAAKKQGMILKAGTVPAPGALFFVWSASRKRFAHIGVVTAHPGTISCNTSKPGDTNPETAREGWGTFEKPWPFTKQDAFAHWWL